MHCIICEKLSSHVRCIFITGRSVDGRVITKVQNMDDDEKIVEHGGLQGNVSEIFKEHSVTLKIKSKLINYSYVSITGSFFHVKGVHRGRFRISFTVHHSTHAYNTDKYYLFSCTKYSR